MFRYESGVIYKGDGADQPPVAIVTASLELLRSYVEGPAIGPWVWVRSLDDLPGEPLGGMALLDQEPLPDDLRDAVLAACLRSA